MYERRLVKDYFIHEKEKIHNLKIIDRELKVEFIEGKAIAIVGPRRSGKTFFLKSFSLKQILHIFFPCKTFFARSTIAFTYLESFLILSTLSLAS